MARRLSSSVVVGLQSSGDTGHGHAVVRTARSGLNAPLCFGRTPEAACSALARFAWPHCSPCRGLRGLDRRKHRGSGPGELDRTGIGWKPTYCRAPRSCSRSGIRPRHICHRGPRCGQTCRHLESRRPPCRRRTDRSRPGHLCARHRMGDPSDGGSVDRLVRPSRLCQSVRHWVGPGRRPLGGLRVCARVPGDPGSSRASDQDQRTEGYGVGYWRSSASSPPSSWHSSYVSSASALQEDLQGTARYVALHAQSGDVIALPDHAITAAIGYYLASDGRARSPLATTGRSPALRRRIRPLTLSVFVQSPPPPGVGGDGRQWRRHRALREDPLRRRLCAITAETVHRGRHFRSTTSPRTPSRAS